MHTYESMLCAVFIIVDACESVRMWKKQRADDGDDVCVSVCELHI